MEDKDYEETINRLSKEVTTIGGKETSQVKPESSTKSFLQGVNVTYILYCAIPVVVLFIFMFTKPSVITKSVKVETDVPTEPPVFETKLDFKKLAIATVAISAPLVIALFMYNKKIKSVPQVNEDL